MPRSACICQSIRNPHGIEFYTKYSQQYMHSNYKVSKTMSDSQAPPYDLFAPPAYRKESVQLISITIYESDGITVIGAPQHLMDKLRIALSEIHKTWGWGQIQKENRFLYAYEFKLKGVPWYGVGRDAVGSRQLMIGILKCMALQGWNLLQSVDLSKLRFDADTLFFENGLIDHKADIFAISMNKTDRIRLILPQKPTRFPQLVPTFKDIVTTRWEPGIQDEQDSKDFYEFKLVGNPWKSLDDLESYRAKLLITRIIAGFTSIGFKLYASIDMSTGTKDKGDMDTLFFRNISQTWPVPFVTKNKVGKDKKEKQSTSK